MGNPLYDETKNATPYASMVGQIKKFSQTIQGDPKQMVEELLASGKMNQQQFNRYTQMAQNILPFVR